MDSRSLALGTAQFGMPYGLTNRTGKVRLEAVARIIDRARAAGIDTLDTAIAYGDSEAQLGAVGVADWHVISKLPELPQACPRASEWVDGLVTGSLTRLRIPRLRGLLLHHPQQLLEPRGSELYAALVALKEAGSIEKIGVSVYAPAELDALVPRFRLDLVQAPFNVVDRRLATSGWLSRLDGLGVEVHVRSVFLQGLLLMSSAERPETFMRWHELWDRWHGWLADKALTPLQACLSFAGHYTGISRVIVGVDGLQQLEEILAALAVDACAAPASLASEERDLVDPSRWDQR